MPSDNSEWSSNPKELVRNVHNDRDPKPVQDARPELSDVLSAKNHELGYSIIINSSVGQYDPLKGLKKYAFPGVPLKTAVRNTVKYTGVYVCLPFM